MKLKSAILLFAICVMMSTSIFVSTVLSGPPYYHEEGNVNYLGSYFQSTYISKGIGIDDYITIVDLALMARAYGKFSWEPNGVGWGLYNPDADINSDTIVDVVDLWIAATYWGLNYVYSPFPNGNPPTRVIVDAPNPPISAGNQFSVDIRIQSVTNLNTYEFTLSWNPNVLALITVAPDSFLTGTVTWNLISGAGYLYFGATSTQQTANSGNGILTTITFRCLQATQGPTTIDLSSRLFDIHLNSINHRDYDDSVLQQ